jgi:predicted DNA-binding transcriptional regulator AlpA
MELDRADAGTVSTTSRRAGRDSSSLTKGTAAGCSACRAPWLYQAAADGRIPHVRLGSNDGLIRFVPTDIEQWLENARRQWRPGRLHPQLDQPDGEAG